jgi:hypothetical protein
MPRASTTLLSRQFQGDVGSAVGDTRGVPLERFVQPRERRPGDIKVIIDFLQ